MSFNIGNILSNINFGTVLKDAGKVVSELGTIAGPKAQWPQYASQFEQKLFSNPLLQPNWGPLPNPIHALAQLLFKDAGSFIDGLGKNVSAFGLGLEGQQPRSVKGVDQPVTLPSMSSPQRLYAMAASTAAAQSAGGSPSSASTTPSGTGIDISNLFGGSTSGVSALAAAGDSLFSKENDLFNQMAQLAGSGDPSSQGKLLQLQAKLQQIQQLITMITNMMQSDNETKKSVIQNIRA